MSISSPQGDLSPVLPTSVTVRFPTRVCPGGCTPPGGQEPPKWYISTVQLLQVTIAASGQNFKGSPQTYVVHDNCIATYDGVTSLPTNQAKLDALAKQIATDFYKWRTLSYDLVYNGVVSPTLDASVDTLEIKHTINDVYTRFTSQPWNGEPEEFFHNDVSCVYPLAVVYVPTASRVGSFLRMPKGVLSLDAQNELMICTSSYDDIFMCSTSSTGLMAMRPDFEAMKAWATPPPPPQTSERAGDLASTADLAGATSIPLFPSLCDGNGDTVDLAGHFAGRTVFLLGGGPSLADVDLKNLEKSGIITIALNNVSELIHPTMWMAVDDPAKFPQEIFDDPTTLKFLPRCMAARPLPDGRIVDDHASVLYFRRNGRFDPSVFLTEGTFNWGCDTNTPDTSGRRGSRSVMLPALKLLNYLGVRRVVLLGCDFHMSTERPYAHSEAKSAVAVNSNNHKYEILDARFAELRPAFDAAGFTVLNGTPGSHLTAFDHVDYKEVLKECEAESYSNLQSV